MSGAPASYDLNEIFDALAEVWSGMTTGDKIGGQDVKIISEPEVAGDIQTPAVVLEIQDLTYDLNMGDGADGIEIVATALVQEVDSRGAQRALRTFLSRKPTAGVARLKAALEEDETLGGLVSYAHMSGTGRIGRITYDGVDYLGVELLVEVIS